MALVVVQRGHVPRTKGATGAPGEQRFTTAAADCCAAHLRAAGHQCRIIDADVPRSDYRGDFFVAIHYDSSTIASVRGASVGWQTLDGQGFAHKWKRHYAAAGWSGGFRPDNYTAALAGYYGVRNAVAVGNRRAFIAEAGFHSNPRDAALLAAPAGPDRVARAITAAVVEILGTPPTPLPTPAVPPPDTSVEDDMDWIILAPARPAALLLGAAGKLVKLGEQKSVDGFLAHGAKGPVPISTAEYDNLDHAQEL